MACGGAVCGDDQHKRAAEGKIGLERVLLRLERGRVLQVFKVCTLHSALNTCTHLSKR